MRLDAGGEQPVERVYPVLGVTADHAAAQVGVGRVEAHAQRAHALLDDARLVGGREVGERDEGAGQKAQAEVVVAQAERGAAALGQLAHEAEDACVAAELDAVEHHAPERDAPILAALALELDLARLAVEVDVAHGDDVV